MSQWRTRRGCIVRPEMRRERGAELAVDTPTTPTLCELTIRGILLVGVIRLVFTAANVYLGLKVRLTFATAIRRR